MCLFFFQHESQYKEPVKPSPCLFSVAPLKCKAHLLCRCPGRCLNVQVCAQAKSRVQAQRFKYRDLSVWTWHCHFKTRDVDIKVFHSPEGKDYFTPFQTMSLISLPFLQPSLSLSLTYILFLIPSLPLHFKPWEKPRKRSLPTKGPFHCIVFSS